MGAVWLTELARDGASALEARGGRAAQGLRPRERIPGVGPDVGGATLRGVI